MGNYSQEKFMNSVFTFYWIWIRIHYEYRCRFGTLNALILLEHWFFLANSVEIIPVIVEHGWKLGPNPLAHKMEDIHGTLIMNDTNIVFA